MSTIKLTATGGGGGTVSLKAPAATSSNAALELTLPVDDGTSGQYLKTDGSGVLSFATAASNGITGPCFRVSRNSGTQNVDTSTATLVEFNLEDYDSASAWNTSTHRFTPQVAGWYQFNGQITLNTGATNCILQVGLYKNGTEVRWAQQHSDAQAIDHTLQITSQIEVNGSSDYIDIRVWQNIGSTIGIVERTNKVTFFEGFLVRAT